MGPKKWQLVTKATCHLKMDFLMEVALASEVFMKAGFLHIVVIICFCMHVKSFPLQRRKIIIKGSLVEESGKKRAKNNLFLDVKSDKCTRKMQVMQKIRW